MTETNTTSYIHECVDELMKLYEQHKHNEPDTINEYIMELKGDGKLFVDVDNTCNFAYRVLKEVVKRYKIAPIEESLFIKSDVKRLCVLLFKPYFRTDYWIRDACRKYANESSDYKFEHGIIDNEPEHDIYNSTIEYLKDFVVNLAI